MCSHEDEATHGCDWDEEEEIEEDSGESRTVQQFLDKVQWSEDYASCVSSILSGRADWLNHSYMMSNATKDEQCSLCGPVRMSSHLYSVHVLCPVCLDVLDWHGSSYESIEHAINILADLSLRDPVGFSKACDLKKLSEYLEDLSSC